MSKNYRKSASVRHKQMMRKPYIASINGGLDDYLPTSHHRPLEAGYHEIPIHGSEARVVVCAGPDSHFLKITVGR